MCFLVASFLSIVFLKWFFRYVESVGRKSRSNKHLLIAFFTGSFSIGLITLSIVMADDNPFNFVPPVSAFGAGCLGIFTVISAGLSILFKLQEKNPQNV